MKRETFRTIGAITGLVAGLVVMYLLGMGGLVPAAVFGAGGCVLGGISGEQIHDRSGS
ncbi:hypothetical protein [Neorhodopirellula pilleata]|uniref:Uncharacterized protein n=1 Tax=Neorhodopirellula pilleata TaxID=2714738 RepID=A0A5C6A820_9BACT|nr:hypothetical protein [Neorhodopirellula pilleata]TWT95537.1 hypothetical protein Pla100_31780 [Neorhodopirellula pilleata]